MIRIAALMALSVAALGQPKDIDGWQNIKWGMTVSQASKVLGTPCEPIGKSPSPGEERSARELNQRPYPQDERITLKEVRLGRYTGEATIKTKHNSETVSLVVVHLFIEPNTRSDRGRAYSELKAMLIGAHGTPTHQTEKYSEMSESTDARAVWIFSSTTITLVQTEAGEEKDQGYDHARREWSAAGFSFGSVHVEYAPTKR